MLFVLAWFAVLPCFAAAPISAGPSNDDNPPRPSALVPAYFYPAGAGLKAWQRLAEDARTNTVQAILNPASGPGEKRDPTYVSVVRNFRKAGGRVLGYIPTDYAKRAIADVERDLRTYLKFYEVDGIFLDEMARSKETLPYYRKLHRLIKDLKPDFKIVGNPGQPFVDEGIMETVDCVVLFEGSAAGYAGYKPQESTPWIVRYPAKHFANIVHTAATPAAMRQAVEKAKVSKAGWLFITNRVMPNPYDALPDYWSEEIRTFENTSRER